MISIIYMAHAIVITNDPVKSRFVHCCWYHRRKKLIEIMHNPKATVLKMISDLRGVNVLVHRERNARIGPTVSITLILLVHLWTRLKTPTLVRAGRNPTVDWMAIPIINRSLSISVRRITTVLVGVALLHPFSLLK